MNKRILNFALLITITAGCTQRIEVKLDTTYTRLVVDGHIANENGPYKIILTKSTDYFYNAPAPRVTGASIELTDGTATYPVTETIPGQSGIYATDSTFQGQINKTYTLHMELAQPISQHSSFEATCTLNPVTHVDSVTTEFHPEYGKEGAWLVNLWAQDPGNQVNYYMFNLYKNGKLLTDSIQKVRVSNDQLINGKYMTGIPIFRLNNANKWESIAVGDTIILQMSGISKEYYNFVNQVKQAGFNLPFFSGPPANVQGNINNGGIGFFSAYSNSYASRVVN